MPEVSTFTPTVSAPPTLPTQHTLLPDLPDSRDLIFDASKEAPNPLPFAADLRSLCPPVYDQLILGSCTANAIAAAIEYERARQHLQPVFIPSRLFIYYNERTCENTQALDKGAYIRDGIKCVVDQGACAEDVWPYDPTKFNIQPPQSCYDAALKDKVILYQSISQDLTQLKGCLASGYPFIFGMAVYSSMLMPPGRFTGSIPMPTATDQYHGGHAVLAVGYDDQASHFIIRNSWGSQWGASGHFTLPYAYMNASNYTHDFWTLRLIDPGTVPAQTVAQATPPIPTQETLADATLLARLLG